MLRKAFFYPLWSSDHAARRLLRSRVGAEPKKIPVTRLIRRIEIVCLHLGRTLL